MQPFALVIFGASGDLASRKLLPAVHRLFQEGLLPERFAVVGFARTEMSDEAFRHAARQALGIRSALLLRCPGCVAGIVLREPCVPVHAGDHGPEVREALLVRA